MKLYGKDIEPDCRYCACPADAACRKKAEAKRKTSCRKFIYDPLLRKPHKPPTLPSFSPDDFKL